MQREMNNRVCPLCKQAAATETGANRPATQLCSQCQEMIQRIIPRNNYAASTMVVEQPQYAPASFAPPLAEEADFFDTAEESFNRPDFDLVEETGYPHASQQQDDDQEIYMDLQPPDEDDPDRRSQSYDILEPPPIPETRDKLAAGFEREEVGPLHQPDFLSANIISESKQPESLLADHQAEAVDELSNQEHNESLPDSATDPWDDPLPSWDHSQHEWPLMVGTRQPDALARLRLPVAVLALLAACAAIYFFAYRALSEPVESAATHQQESSPAQPANDVAASSEPQQAPATEAALAVEAAPTNELISAEGAYSLQAASFPNEAAAIEFSQKLASAGIDAYIVPADIAGRGRWFRVRAGRFLTTDEAQKYAALSRQRARAAGMNIQLIVCDYGKN